MLPTPVFSRRTQGPLAVRLSTLRQRSRVTNLAVLILLVSFTFSLLLNLQLWLTSSTTSIIVPTTSYGEYERHRVHSDSSLSTIPGRIPAKNLVVVAGHAIWKGCLPERRLDDSDWILEEYQKGTKSITAFFSHIVKGAEAALADKRSLLIFSGGHTRGTSTTSEGESYFRLAIESNVFHNGYLPFKRATSEEYSLDSYQNLLFSIARFHEVTGSYPEHITVVGFEMKRRRFEELHIHALRWPKGRFTYIGIDEYGDTTRQYKGEEENGYTPYSQDLYGCHGKLLEKRRNRNPFFRFHPYYTSASELTGLLDWCPDDSDGGMTAIYPGRLPWDHI
ncbi:hypothetical protein K439DRAFT_1630961 [Ramaria rubella]|nr:hypothetical protein K439DRAFT_1630961 [Ramaria rubella]